MAGLSTDLEEKLSRVTLVTNRTKEMIDQALSRFKVEWDEFSFSLGGSAKGTESTLKELIARTTQSAIRAGKSGLAILLDEAQVLTDDSDRSGEHPLSMLVAAINSLQERGVPVALVLCGLPTLKANLLKARTYSERMFKGAEVDRLSKPDTRDAFLKPLEETRVTASANLIEAVLDDVEGYPYFIQLWGAELWDEAQLAGLTELTTELLDQMRDAIYKRLDLDFYDTRVVSLRPAEQDLLLLTAQCDYPPLRTSDVRSLTEKKEANVNVLMGRLAEQGVVYRISKGIYEYTAPKFHEYLKRRATKGEWV